jgi:glutamate/tyrosine decarboxylase-like PLP-dependent enzyme
MKKAEQAWNQAEACERHAQATKDTTLQAKFRKLRDSWIRIGNTVQFQESDKKEEDSTPAHDSRERTERVQVYLSKEEIAAIEDFRFENRMPNRAVAVRELIRRGLTASPSPG